MCLVFTSFFERKCTLENIRIDKHAQKRCCFSSCQQKPADEMHVFSFSASCPSHDARIPSWEGGTVVYFDNAWKIPLPSLGMLHHYWAFGEYFSGFFSTWSTIMREFSGESRCWSTLQVPQQDVQLTFFFFPGCVCKMSYASGGIIAGNCRDSPHEQDDDIVVIVFLFSLRQTSDPSLLFFLNPHIKLPAKYHWLKRADRFGHSLCYCKWLRKTSHLAQFYLGSNESKVHELCQSSQPSSSLVNK